MFKRTVENFVCENCNMEVIGSGYTNHCPHCLWSKHVDIQPGDRAQGCKGLMEPCALEGSSPAYDIVHVCQICGLRRRNKTSPKDDQGALLFVAQKSAAH